MIKAIYFFSLVVQSAVTPDGGIESQYLYLSTVPGKQEAILRLFTKTSDDHRTRYTSPKWRSQTLPVKRMRSCGEYHTMENAR